MSHALSHGEFKERGIGQFVVYVLVVLFLIGGALRYHAHTEIRSVQIHGLTYLDESEIRSVLDSLGVVQSSDVSLNDIRLAVQRNPFIRRVEVQRISDDQLELNIFERVPFALMVHEGGMLQYLDEDATTLPYRMIAQGSDVPLMSGFGSMSKTDSNAVASACLILREMRRAESGTMYSNVSEIAFDEETKTYTIRTSAEDTKIFFGGAEECAKKVSSLYSISRYLAQQNDQRAASVIDVRWHDKVFVSWN